ncbi:MAG TPA: PhzF family phenazine biosynthesis protein, partial [Devosia sp.]|nr:PhzF family phenazine biosynthesis protein [Devosia sp.]
GFSETVFLQTPESRRNAARVRIFTPFGELPFAGHPTIGAAVHLGLRRGVSAIRLEENVGVITCVVERRSRRVGQASFRIPEHPVETGSLPGADRIGPALGLAASDIGFSDHVPGRWSAGLEFTLVPVRDGNALSAIVPDVANWASVFGRGHGANVYAYTASPEGATCDFCARMLSPDLGEDAATGSAAAALIGPVAQRNARADGQTNLVVEQGVDMGRPSRITMQISRRNGELVHAGIGGSAVIVGEGELEF